MGEREQFKNILKKVITDTENDKITTSEQLIEILINEITSKNLMKEQTVRSQPFAN